MPSWQFSGVLARGGAPSGNISQTQTPLAVFAGLSQSFFFPAAANSQPRFAGRALRLPGLDHSGWKYDLAICDGGPVDSVKSSTVSAVDTTVDTVSCFIYYYLSPYKMIMSRDRLCMKIRFLYWKFPKVITQNVIQSGSRARKCPVWSIYIRY